MSEIKALEKLREKIRLDVNNPWSDLKGDLLAMCDKLEREIAEKYMELPEDGDGKPTRVGDHMEREGELFTVCAIAPARVHYWVWDKNGKCSTVDCDPMECSHYKPRTLEDVLRECVMQSMTVDRVVNGIPVLGVDETMFGDWIAENEDELRELLRGDA